MSNFPKLSQDWLQRPEPSWFLTCSRASLIYVLACYPPLDRSPSWLAYVDYEKALAAARLSGSPLYGKGPVMVEFFSGFTYGHSKKPVVEMQEPKAWLLGGGSRDGE